MYGHLKALTGMGKGAGDIPVGSSMSSEPARGSTVRTSSAPLTGWGAGRAAGEAAMKGGAGSAVADAIAASVKTGAKGVGAGNVHGFASKTAAKPSVHNHADSFQRSKGVVNTVGGAKDINRAERGEPAKLPAKGEAKGAQVMGFSTLDAHTAEGKARREAAEKRESAGGNAHKMNLVHVSGGGGRPCVPGACRACDGAVPRERLTITPPRSLPCPPSRAARRTRCPTPTSGGWART